MAVGTCTISHYYQLSHWITEASWIWIEWSFCLVSMSVGTELNRADFFSKVFKICELTQVWLFFLSIRFHLLKARQSTFSRLKCANGAKKRCAVFILIVDFNFKISQPWTCQFKCFLKFRELEGYKKIFLWKLISKRISFFWFALVHWSFSNCLLTMFLLTSLSC